MSQYFSKSYEPFGGDIKMLKLICLVMQQKQIPETFQITILQVLH